MLVTPLTITQRLWDARVVKRGSSSHPFIYKGGTTTTATTPPHGDSYTAENFCEICADWIVEEGWQEDGTYFCPTCLESRNVELVWRQNEGLVQDTTEKFS